jgi:TatD DNase family protein
LIRLDTVKETAKILKGKGAKLRINTAGLANRYYGKNILPELEGLIDAVSISLNGGNPKEHNELNRPQFGEESFNEIIKFAKEAKKYIPLVIITAVELPSLDISKIAPIAKEAGAHFRIRPYLDNDEK